MGFCEIKRTEAGEQNRTTVFDGSRITTKASMHGTPFHV
jgi:hypothetical protein